MNYLKLAYFLNVMSFLVYQIHRLQAHHGALLITHRSARQSREMTYLLAGMLNQPQVAFRFLNKELKGGVTNVQYSCLGWDSWGTALQIATDVTKHNYQATVYSISVGDKVARELENILGERVRIITINPCTEPRFLKPVLYAGAKLLSPILLLLCYLLGWLSVAPILEIFSEEFRHYSLFLLACQAYEIAYIIPVRTTARTRGVLCSTDDEFLQNARIRDYFEDCRRILICSQHARTTGEPSKYLDAVRELMQELD